MRAHELTATSSGSSDPAAITVAPEHVVIDNLRPGDTGLAQVAVTNTSVLPAQVSVTGHLTSDHEISADDALSVGLAACPQPWAGVPEQPTEPGAAPVCAAGEIPSSGGSLAAVPLGEGHTVYLLISAQLGQDAGPGAMGQRWTATFDVTTTSTAEPAETPDLAVTGVPAGGLLAAAALAIGAGVLARRAHRTHHRKGTEL